MKDFQYVISNTYNKYNFKKVYTIEIINKLIGTLPYNLRKSFMYSSIKGQNLFIAFDHPTSVSEFNNYKKNIILDVINTLVKQNPNKFKELEKIKDIKAYLPRNILNRFDIGEVNIEYKIIEYYKENAKGDFKVDKNSQYDKEFLAIKNAIKVNNETNK